MRNEWMKLSRHIIVSVVFVIVIACALTAHADHVVMVNPIRDLDKIHKIIDAIPESQTLEKVSINTPKKITVYYALSGFIEKNEIEQILLAININSELKTLPDHWKMSIHGNESYARLSIYPECSASAHWLLAKVGMKWDVIDVSMIPGICWQEPPVRTIFPVTRL